MQQDLAALGKLTREPGPDKFNQDVYKADVTRRFGGSALLQYGRMASVGVVLMPPLSNPGNPQPIFLASVLKAAFATSVSCSSVTSVLQFVAKAL